GVVAMVQLTNTGNRPVAKLVQVYVGGSSWAAPSRLGGFAKVDLAPGERRRIEMSIDPRLLATWFTGRPGWTRPAGAYTVSVRHSSRELVETVMVELPPSHLAPGWKPDR